MCVARFLFFFLVISSEHFKSLNCFSNEILETIFKYLTNEQLKQSCLTVNQQWNQCARNVLEKRSPITNLPNEILLKIFANYLNPFDLLNSCVRVNRQWKQLIQANFIWKIVNPINWAKSEWNSNVPAELIRSDAENLLKYVN